MQNVLPFVASIHRLLLRALRIDILVAFYSVYIRTSSNCSIPMNISVVQAFHLFSVLQTVELANCSIETEWKWDRALTLYCCILYVALLQNFISWILNVRLSRRRDRIQPNCAIQRCVCWWGTARSWKGGTSKVERAVRKVCALL